MNRPLLNHKPITLLIIIGLLLVVSIPIIRPFEGVFAQTSNQNQSYVREFSWDYAGNHWNWNLSIPVALYDSYKAVPDSERTRNGPAGYDMMVTTQDTYIQSLAEKINETSSQLGYGSYDKVNFALALVQSITYNSDLNTTGYEEYPRFPVETLVDQTGDCDCKAILFATLALSLGYGAVFINPTDHLAVGVLGNDLQGTYWTYENNTYYYAETTGTGFKIGDLPDEFKGQTAYVYPIDESNQFVLNSQATSTNGPNPIILPYPFDTPTPAPTANSGTIPAATPDISQPKIEQAQPISLNLISDNPIPFIIIVIAIGISIAVTVKTTTSSKKPKANRQTLAIESSPIPSENPAAIENSPVETTENNAEISKFCIFCGSGNKSFASYCEKCGKKIS
jgi:hypothetical protein